MPEEQTSAQQAYREPPEGKEPPVWELDGHLAVRTGSRAPKVCLRCGSTRDVVRVPEVLTWVPKEHRVNRALWGTLFGALGGAIAGAMEDRHRKWAKLDVPICAACQVRRRSARWYALLAAIAFGILMFYVFQSARALGIWLVLGLLVGGVLGLVVIVRVLASRWKTEPERIEDGFVVFRVSERVMEAMLSRTQKRARK